MSRNKSSWESAYEEPGVCFLDPIGHDEVISSGTLSILDGRSECHESVIVWKQDSCSEGSVRSESGLPSSFQQKGWTVIPHRDLEVEIVGLKGYRLKEEGRHLVLIQKDGTSHKPLLFMCQSSLSRFCEALSRFVSVRRSPHDKELYLITNSETKALEESLTALNLFHGQSNWRIPDVANFPLSSWTLKLKDQFLRYAVDADLRSEKETSEVIQTTPSPSSFDMFDVDGGFEVIIPRPQLMADLPEVERSEPLCQLDWELHLEEDGSVNDVDKLKIKIFKGGVEPQIRSEVWKFILNYYDFNSTREEREDLRREKAKEYSRMKLQWQSVSASQESRFSAFRVRKVQIEKDIIRTDRDHPFFQGEDNENVLLLRDILMTYAMYNFDLGYVQGMSDLLSPILYIMRNEVDAFWCFVGFMERVQSNFEQSGITLQISRLVQLQKLSNSDLYSYLQNKSSGEMYFTFRWLLIWFKREFKYDEVMRLWEVLWTGLPGENFHLMICLAILDGEKSTIIDNQFGFTEIIKHINNMAYNINLDFVLKKAEAMYYKIKASSPEDGVSNEVKNIFHSSASTEPIQIFSNNNVESGLLGKKKYTKRRRRSSDETASSLDHSDDALSGFESTLFMGSPSE